MFRRSTERSRDDRGVVLILMALTLTAMLIASAMAVDLGNARQFKRQAQATADAAALAGAGNLDGTQTPAVRAQAVAAVKLYAQRNFEVDPASWNGCGAAGSVPAGWIAADAGNGNYCILIDQAHERVRIVELPRRPVLTYFGRLAGVDQIDITAAAAAIRTTGVTAPCGFCVLGPFTGQNGDITVSGDAGVAIDGDASTGPNGSVTVTGPGHGITLFRNGTHSGTFTPTPISVGGTLADPLAGVPVPSAVGPVRSACLDGPGVYTSIPTGCTLQPGLYVITGGTHIAGHTVIDGTAGVTLYLTCGGASGYRPCNPDESGAELTCAGNARALINSQAPGQPAVGGAIPGMAIFYDRNNTGALDCRGNGGVFAVGTIYGRSATLWMRGNGRCIYDRSMVVVGAVRMSGNPSNCRIHYEADENFQLQGVTALIQ